jgi:hypothetical protein
MKLTTKSIALIAVFAALYYIVSLISPFIPAVAIPEITIKLEALIASIYGILMGPYLGFLTALLGAVITWILPPSGGISYGLPFLLSPPLNALVVGLIFYKKWKYAFGVLAVLILAFWFLPPSQPLSEFWYVGFAVTWDKIIALALIFPVVKLAKFKSLKMQALFYFLLAFIGNQTDNMWGSNIFAVPVVYEVIFGYNLEAVRVGFIVSPFIYPAIRIIQSIIATVITVPLVKALESSDIIPIKDSIIGIINKFIAK